MSYRRTSDASGDPAPLSVRDFHILFHLAARDCHGYGLVKAIEKSSDGALRLDPSNLYRGIQKLVAAGLIADADERPLGDSGERRRTYRITRQGRSRLTVELGRMRRLLAEADAKRLVASKDGSP